MKRPLSTAFAIALAGLGFTAPQLRAEGATVAELASITHIHGLAVDRSDASRLFIATHHGLFSAKADGQAELVSEVQDFMGFNPHPTEPNTLFASGHPASGGNLGFIQSTDGGRTWRQISPGQNGPVDFHQMAVSPADPKTIYGAYRGLQVSHDGGRTWRIAGPLPEGLIDIAASAQNRDTLYAATEAGLLASADGASSWKPILEGSPVTTVETAADGHLLIYAIGRGLLRSSEQSPEFGVVGNPEPDGYLLHLAVHPADPDRLFAATREGRIVTSADGGSTWAPFGSGF